jgi:PST family polysaccharide transporter
VSVTARGSKASGYAWSFLQQGAEQVLSFSVSVILARILMPRDFGMVAMIAALTGFATVLVDFGFANALIHNERESDSANSTAFWTSLGIGLTLTLLVCAFAPAMAAFYDEPRIIPLARLMSINFTLSSLTTVDQAILRRRLDFKGLAQISILSSIPSAFSGVGLALLGVGPLAIIAQTLVRTGATLLLLKRRSRFAPSLSFSISELKGMTRYGAGIIGANTVNYWARNTDSILVGKFMGSTELGLYNRGYALMLLARNVISQVINAVLFPSLARQTGKQFGSEFMQVAERVGLITCPMMLGLLASADSAIPTIYGEKWSGAIWVVRALAPLGLYQSIVSLYGPLYLASGRTDLDFKVSMFVEPVIIGTSVVGVRWGLPGLIAGLYVGSAINFWVINVVPLKIAGLRLRDMARSLYGSFTAGGLMAAVVYGVGAVLTSQPPPLRFAAQLVLGVVSYPAFCLLLRVRPAMEMWSAGLRRYARAP